MVKEYSWYRNVLYSLTAMMSIGCQNCSTPQQNSPIEPMPKATATASMATSLTGPSAFPCTMDLETIVAYKGIKDGSGSSYFTDDQICLLKDVSPEYSEFLVNTNRVPAFSAADILILSQYSTPREYARTLGEVWETMTIGKFTSFEIARLYQLGLQLEDVVKFNDTSKKNLIVVYPYSLKDLAFENKQAFELFEGFKKNYDVQVVFASEENDPCSVIQKIPHASLFVNGHGSKTTLNFGNNGPFNSDGSNEKLFWDTGDRELSTCLANLDPSGFIFLFSCATAEGGIQNTGNLCNFIASQAPGRDVICAKANMDAAEVEVDSYDPLKLKINIAVRIRMYKSLLTTSSSTSH